MSGAAEIPVPSAEAVRNSLARLAGKETSNPLAPEAVAEEFNLLLAPFARLIEPFEQRAQHVRAAVELAARSLSDERHQIVVRHMLVMTGGKRDVSKKRQAAFIELRSLVRGNSATGVVGRLEQTAYPALAAILVSETFAREFAQAAGVPMHPALPPVRQPGLAYIRQCWALEYDDADPKKLVSHRATQVRAIRGGERVFEARYYGGYREPDAIEVLSTQAGHSYMASRPDREAGKPAGWWMHYFHLGHVLQAGETTTLIWREEATEIEPEAEVHLAMAVMHPESEGVQLAVKLPAAYRVAGNARIVADPFDRRDIIEQRSIEPNEDGWIIAGFEDVKPGLQYGIFFPNIDFFNAS